MEKASKMNFFGKKQNKQICDTKPSHSLAFVKLSAIFDIKIKKSASFLAIGYREHPNTYVPWSKVAILGMVIPPLIGNPYNGYIFTPTDLG